MNIKRRLGQSNIMLSPLGVGTWQFSNKSGTWNTVTDKTGKNFDIFIPNEKS